MLRSEGERGEGEETEILTEQLFPEAYLRSQEETVARGA